MSLENQNTDEYLLAELGKRFARERLDLGITQADLAFEAGISKRTLERIEAGKAVQFTSVIRVLRALRLVPNLNALVPKTGQRPMDILRSRQGKQRQRAPSSRPNVVREPPGVWRWGDEQ